MFPTGRIRLVALLAVLILAAVAAPSASASRSASRHARTFEGKLLSQINLARTMNGLRPLHLNRALGRAAEQYSNELAGLRTLSHVSPDGATPEDRAAAAGYHGTYIGENLAVGMGPVMTVRAWMASPGHRANLLNSAFHVVGLGAAAGVFGPEVTVYVTADFGS
jgi:uncharacterized protein YkwD